MLELLRHQLKEKLRSSFWQKSLWLNILLAIFGLYFLVNIAALGYLADSIIEKYFPGRNPVDTFSGFIFYYLIVDLLIRFLFVKIPALSIQPYLTLPIKKSTLLHYPLIKSITTFFNLVPLLLIIPFFVKVICKDYPVYFCAGWLITALSFVLFNIFLNFSLKKFFIKRPLMIFLLVGLIGSSLYLDNQGYTNFSGYFSAIFLYFVNRPGFVIIPVVCAVFSYFLGYKILGKETYLEESKAIKPHFTGDFLLLTRYGETGILLRNEIKLIIRNKRPKSMLMFTLLMFFYAWILYTKSNLAHIQILIFAGFLLTTPLSITYGQYSFAWEGCFFDCYLSNNITAINYLMSKYILFAVTGIATFLLTLPFAFLSYKIALVNLAMLMYNAGITSLIVIFMGTFNSTRIDLGRSQFMNYQGMGFSQWLIILPLFGIPAILCLFAWLSGDIHYVIYLFAITGILGIIFHKYLVKMLARQFLRRKYKMALGFRQN